MALMGRFYIYKFEVTKKHILGWNSFSASGGSELNKKDTGQTQYVIRKGPKPIQVDMTVVLSARMGIDVRAYAISFIADARLGRTDYLYIGKKKLIPFRLMLTDAKVTDIDIAPKGVWKSATVALTFQQSKGVTDASSSSSKSSSSSSSSYYDYDDDDNDDYVVHGGGGGGGSSRSVRRSSVKSTSGSSSSSKKKKKKIAGKAPVIAAAQTTNVKVAGKAGLIAKAAIKSGKQATADKIKKGGGG